MRMWKTLALSGAILVAIPALWGCDSEDGTESAQVALLNDFANPDGPRQAKWTVCDAYYGGARFGLVGLGETSEPQEVEPGLGPVLMVCAWDDPTCAPENCLPIATKQEEETVPGQERTIGLTVTNHQGPCPPEGIQPMPEELYEEIRAMWPEYGFRPWAERAENTECLD